MKRLEKMINKHLINITIVIMIATIFVSVISLCFFSSWILKLIPTITFIILLICNWMYLIKYWTNN